MSTDNISNRQCSIFVGYPKSIYNEDNNNLSITNTAQLYGTYLTETEEVLLSEDDININLSNYEFSYSGDLYGMYKKVYTRLSSNSFYYQNILDRNITNCTSTWYLNPIVKYTGTPLTVRVGDDLLFASDINGNSSKLSDNDYYFKSVQIPKLYNSNQQYIAATKYPIKLFVRHANSSEYVQYGDTLTSYSRITFTEEDKVVGFYFQIEDLKEGLLSIDSTNVSSGVYNYSYISCQTVFNPQNLDNIPQKGTIYNFGYINVFTKDSNGNLILQNEPDISSYSTEATKRDIATFDKNTYGHYMQRSYSGESWVYYNVKQPSAAIYDCKTAGAISQNAEQEYFTGNFEIYGGTHQYIDSFNIPINQYFEQYSQNCKGLEYIYMEDLLPEGIELTSTTEDILNSLNLYGLVYSNGNGIYNYRPNSTYTLDGKNPFKSTQDAIKYIKQRTNIKITENYENTNRTRIFITIDLSDNPMVVTNSLTPSFTYEYKVSYDSFLTYGNVYTNTVETWSNLVPTHSKASASATITSVVSTHQDVQTQVQTANDNFTVGKGTSPYGDEYTYKLRARTGQNAATNMVIANNLEMAFNNKKHWQGEFLGVDTSYIENKTFYVYDPSNPNADDEGNVAEKVKVKVYYSENPEETNLYLTEMTQVIEDGNEVSKEVFITDGDGNILKNTNWKEFTDDVDKSSVKSLAFELLNAETGEPAVIPANSLVYVLVTMKAPEDPYLNEDVNEEDRPLANDIKTFSYNNCWTQWTAIDSFGQEVDFVTGINSNIVKVALPYSVDTDEFPTVTLKFIKEISGTDSDFENMLLDKTEERNFKIILTSLTANEDGSYNQITGLLSSTQGLTLSKVPIGTYLITESDDIYFDFVEMVPNNDEELIIDGVTLEKTDKGHVLTISDDLSGDVEFNIKVTNKIETDRPYEDKEEKENLFKIPSVDA